MATLGLLPNYHHANWLVPFSPSDEGLRSVFIATLLSHHYSHVAALENGDVVFL